VPKSEAVHVNFRAKQPRTDRTGHDLMIGSRTRYHQRAGPISRVFISSTVIPTPGFLVSRKVKEIFEEHAIIPHQFFPAAVRHKHVLHTDYFWFHLTEGNATDIDFEQSRLLSFKSIPWEIPGYDQEYTELSIRSFEAYAAEAKRIAGIKNFTAPQLTLAKRLAETDLLTLSGFYSSVVITETLKLAMESRKVNGFRTEPIDFDLRFG
jgi:hypothetical protein